MDWIYVGLMNKESMTGESISQILSQILPMIESRYAYLTHIDGSRISHISNDTGYCKVDSSELRSAISKIKQIDTMEILFTNDGFFRPDPNESWNLYAVKGEVFVKMVDNIVGIYSKNQSIAEQLKKRGDFEEERIGKITELPFYE